MYRHLQHFIEVLEQHNELIRVKTYVNPHLEISEITDRLSKSENMNKAILFENTGYDFPVLINSMGSYKRICLALGVDELDEVKADMEDLFKQLTKPQESLLDKLKLLPQLGKISSWMPKVVSGKGACQEVIMADPDITKLPVLTCWPEDGGPFITLPVIHTKDPITGIRNVGMYRMQIFDKTLTGMHWHKHKVSARHYEEYKKLGKKMPVAVVLGGDPVYTYSATAPLPDNVDEHMLAGFLRKKKVELVKCITQPELEVPADADFVIEGYVDPQEDWIWEGPFGDHTGYYSLADWYPRFHVTAITHRKNAVFPATIVGIPPQEDAWIGKATERIFLAPIKMTMIPEIVDMELPVEGVFHNLTIVKIQKSYPGQAQKVMNAMWGAGQMMFNKILVVVDGDVDIHNYEAVAKYVSENCNPATDIYFSQGPMDVLDHSCSKTGFGGKLCVDGTKKLPEEIMFEEMPIKGQPIDANLLKSKYDFIQDLRVNLTAKGIATLFVTVQKKQKGDVKKWANLLSEESILSDIKTFLFIDSAVDLQQTADVLWRACNNADARRDIWTYQPIDKRAKMIVDGTTKTANLDAFTRDWPNILTHTKETIELVDGRWAEYGLGAFIESPSLRYQAQTYGRGAVITASELEK